MDPLERPNLLQRIKKTRGTFVVSTFLIWDELAKSKQQMFTAP